MEDFQPDEIMLAVPQMYFLVKTIGPYEVYSRYNAEGYNIDYNFVTNLGQAHLEYSLEDGTHGNLANLNESIYFPVIRETTIEGEPRVSIMQQTIAPWDSHTVNSNIIYSNLSISSSSKISFGIGMDPGSWNGTYGAVFSILVQDDKGVHEIFSKYINPNKNIGDRPWQNYLVDLGEFAGKSISVFFVTNAGPSRSNAYGWACWSNPLLLTSH
jgi:hypothetical protein